MHIPNSAGVFVTLIFVCIFLSDFDKFLEERAKAVDTLPSPLGAATAHPARASSGSQKKAERTEDALFTL